MTDTTTDDLKVLILAGPNGAGKTTFAREFLPGEADCPRFINADLIAAGLEPFRPERAAVRAARLMLEEIATQFAARESFAIETTLSGRTYLPKIRQWREAGYHVSLVFLSLESPELALARVARRVEEGGHHIPEPVVRRRFASGLHHFEQDYKTAVDSWIHFDNSGSEPVEIARSIF